MKLALPKLPSGWKEESCDDGSRRILPPQGWQGLNPSVFVVIATLLVGATLWGFGIWNAGHIAVATFAGIVLFLLFGVTVAWHVSDPGFELRTSFFGFHSSRERWESGILQVISPPEGLWELRLVGERGSRWLLAGQLDVLALAAVISERTGWEIQYTDFELVFHKSLDSALKSQDADHLALLMGNRALLPRLAEVAADLRPRSSLLHLLRRAEEQSPSLEAALSDEDPEVQAAAIGLLAAAENRRVLPALRAALESEPDHVRERAAEALGEMQDAEAVPALCRALLRHPAREATIARALGLIGEVEAVPALCKALQTPALSEVFLTSTYRRSREVRREAAIALGRIQSQEAVPALCQALSDEVVQVREAAAHALERIGDPQATLALCRALSDRAGRVAAYSAAALVRIADPSAVPFLCGALVSGVPEARPGSALALGKVGGVPAIEALTQALDDWADEVRLAAATGLAQIAAGSDTPPVQLRTALPALKRLSATLSTQDGDIKRACREALQRIEASTELVKGLPLPSASAPIAPETLPVPSQEAPE